MPELPEVETIARALAPALLERTVTHVEVFSPKLRTPITPLATAGLTGKSFTAVRRRGRYLILDFGDATALLVHLGMTGTIRIEDGNTPKRKHEHIFLHLSDGMIFRFECSRRFSLVELHRLEADGGVAALSGLGVEPLTDGFDGEFLYAASRRSRAPVKTFLMNNSVVVGVGNIYCTEALFASGIDPRRRACDLTHEECGKLAAEIKRLLRYAIECGGSSIRDYKHVDGSAGKFQRELRVYGRSGEKCPVCGAVVESIRQGGRTTAFCPHCQK